MCRFPLLLVNSGKIRTAPTIQLAGRLYVPVPGLAEFCFVILKSRFREKMTVWLDVSPATTTVLAVIETTTRHYAEIRLQAASVGTHIPMNDLWIAAIDRQHKLPDISRDAHYDNVAELTRIGW